MSEVWQPALAGQTDDTYRSQKPLGSFAVALCLCLFIILVSIVSSEQCLHWFIVPITLCGVVIGVDAVDWVRGRVDIFDPVGIIGLLGFHFFFLAPLLHVIWNYWMADYWLVWITLPDDWRPWLGAMAILNLFGIFIYRVSRSYFEKQAQSQSDRVVWLVEKKLFVLVLGAALLMTAGFQVIVYATSGGILGYINSFQTSETAFSGMGWIFMISESFPTLVLIGFALYAQKRQGLKSWTVLVLMLLVFFVLKMLFGGLRGSRSNTIWGLFWAAGIIHFWLRPITKRTIGIGLIFLLLFMYLYGFYKAAGLEGLKALGDPETRASIEAQSGRTSQGLLLADLGRSDVQAFLLYRLMRSDSEYTFAWGRTYLGAAALLIPSSIWPERPPTKVKEGTEAQYGTGSFVPGDVESSRVYGLAGEAMLNFGPFLIPFAFVLLGLVVGKVRRWISTWDASDLRLLLVPFLVNMCFNVLVGDSDNTLFYFIKNGTVPLFVLWIGSRKIKLSMMNGEG